MAYIDHYDLACSALARAEGAIANCRCGKYTAEDESLVLERAFVESMAAQTHALLLGAGYGRSVVRGDDRGEKA